MIRNKVDLIGDGIENPWNAKTMIDIADAFGTNCFFRDRKNLVEAFDASEFSGGRLLKLLLPENIATTYNQVVALENIPDAEDIYGFKLPSDCRAALIAGNERHGISFDVQKTANRVVQIPMFGSKVNTLNVAAAAGVALYYLFAGGGGKLQIRNRPETRRPDILLIGGTDHVELGSSIRSAGAFGWSRLFVDDRKAVWFGCDRAVRAEGRGAARRARNSIRLVPVSKDKSYAFRNVTVISSTQGIPLHKANLAEGPEQLIVIADESCVDVSGEDWQKLGTRVQFAKIEVAAENYAYHFRLFASIALAESARQVGQKIAGKVLRAKQGPVYESSLSLLLEERGEEVFLEDLQEF